jgi:hypothetical protein
MPKLEVNPNEFDSRMTEWNLKVNKITQDQLNSYLKSLPDDAANTENMDIDEAEGTNE